MSPQPHTDDTVPETSADAPQVPPDHGDAQLIRRLLAGDEAAFSELVAQHHNTMVRVARSWLPARGNAEEVVQDTWMAILEGLPRFQGRSSLKTWMFRILANRAHTRARREGRSIPMSAMGALDDDGTPVVNPDRFAADGMWKKAPSTWDGPDKLIERIEIRQQVEAAIDTLPARQRAVVTMRDLDGWTSEEVCAVLEISPTNQRVLLHRARSKVRAVLETYLDGEK